MKPLSETNPYLRNPAIRKEMVDVIQGMRLMNQQTPDGPCTTCPLSMWSLTQSLLAGFCTPLRMMTWLPSVAPVTFCDARERAVAKMLMEGSE